MGNWLCRVYISKHISFEKIRQHYSSGSKGEIDSYLNFALNNLASLPSWLARFDLDGWVTCGNERKPALRFQTSVPPLKQNASFWIPELKTNWTGPSGTWQSPGRGRAVCPTSCRLSELAVPAQQPWTCTLVIFAPSQPQAHLLTVFYIFSAHLWHFSTIMVEGFPFKEMYNK